MKRIFFKGFSAALVLALLFGLFPLQAGTVQAVSNTVVISQVYGGGGNLGATLTNDFIELYNLSADPVDVTGWTVQYASSTGTSWQRTILSGVIQPGNYYLVQEAQGAGGTTPLPAPNATGTIAMSGTVGKVALVSNSTLLTGSCPTAVVDFLGYGAATNCSETTPTANLSNTTAALRNGNGAIDTDNNNADFTIGAPNPRNTPPPDSAPTVASTNPAGGAAGVALNSNVTITFSEAVDVTGDWFALECSASGVHTAAVSGGPTEYVLDPNTDFSFGDACTLTVIASAVTDQDANDPPDGMEANYTAGFNTGDICTAPYTPAYAIQGSGPVPAITGTVTTQGVVVSDDEGASPTLRGFYLQDATGDGDPATSDAIFVYNGSNNSVSLGQVVRVTGTAADFQDQTQVGNVTSIIDCGTGSVEPLDVTLPFASPTAAEAYEGMLVRLPQTLYVTEHFQLGRFGQVVLSEGGRLQQPTNVTTPGASANALQAENNLRRIIVDDSLNNQNPDPVRFARGGQPLSAANTLRGGDTATGIVGVMTYTWAGNAASGNAYRVRPLNALGGYINFEAVNLRPAAAPETTGRLRVAGMNLLNFFNTFADGKTSTPGCFPSGNDSDCRGASSQAEYDRQLPKTVTAILGTQADVIGVIEVENDGYGPESALAALVGALNAQAGPGTYAYIDVDASTGQVNALGTDAIKVGLLYKPARVTPVGTTAALNTVEFVTGGDTAARNRPALAQAFEEPGTGARFVVAVNHLKSKGSACDAPDAGDGQGNCNGVRLNAANLLTAWLAADPTGTGDPDALILGDLNSYALEEPITAIKDAGYTDLINQFIGPDAYSYVFDGQWGYLDHALGNASLTPQVTGVADWHINADEPSALDYNTDFKSANQLALLYAPDEFRIADHDPVLVDLSLTNDPPTAGAGGPYTATEGETVSLSATGSDPEGGAVAFAWDLDNDGVFETPGQAASFAAVDGTFNYPVSVQVTDISGLTTVASTVVQVANAAPAVGSITAPAAPVKVGASITASASFSDAGVLDTHTAAWDWGDGSTTPATVTETGGSGTVSDTHAYAAAGIYPVTLTVTDKDGASASATYNYVVVYNISSGFATGSGWFNSPAGAYPANPGLTGKVAFSFSAKYLKNAAKPSGAAAFTFGAARLAFTSTSFDWLVISGDQAWMQGSGKINGRGSYGFLIAVVDGSPDQIRIRVWDKATGAVVYDTQPGAALPAAPTTPISGSIVVHK